MIIKNQFFSLEKTSNLTGAEIEVDAILRSESDNQTTDVVETLVSIISGD
jgi:hypothetical protein